MRARRLMVLIAIVAPGGCDYLASPDRLVDPDVISIALVLVAGESQAHLLAGHPYLHRSDPPPKVTASLIGPGWRAAFTHKTDPQDGCGGGPTDWPIPMVCLNATLPEPIRERVTYKLEGKGPKGFVHRRDRGAPRSPDSGSVGHRVAPAFHSCSPDPDFATGRPAKSARCAPKCSRRSATAPGPSRSGFGFGPGTWMWTARKPQSRGNTRRGFSGPRCTCRGSDGNTPISGGSTRAAFRGRSSVFPAKASTGILTGARSHPPLRSVWRMAGEYGRHRGRLPALATPPTGLDAHAVSQPG